MRVGGFGSLGSIVYLLSFAWIAAISSYPLNDNSFFTHLATGRLILDAGSVPSRDPYTFTALREPWTVQSWLASVAYAGAERLGGDVGLRALVLVAFATALTLLWRLTAPATSITVRLLIMVLALFVAGDLWSERPYMIGIIGLAAVWLSLNGQLRPWLLVPLLWVWTNTHGSFPLGVVLCLTLVTGGAFDRRRAGQSARPPAHEQRTCLLVLGGILLGAVGPLGIRVLTFPATAITRSDVFAEVIEWQPPSYRSVGERAFLVLLVVSMLALNRVRSWRLTLPALAFAAMGVAAQRNIVMATVVLVAVTAICAPALGTLRSWDRPPLGRPLTSVLALVTAAMCALALLSPVHGFGGYPTRAIARLDVTAPDVRVGTEMATGNLLEVLDGTTGEVFIDDRVDMFPTSVFADYLILRRGDTTWDEVLDRHGIDVVVWGRGLPLAAILAASPDWSISFVDTTSVVACRRSTCPD